MDSPSAHLLCAHSELAARIGEAIKLLPYQHAALHVGARFTWNCWARQSGKSFTFSLRRLQRGILRGRNQIILSAGERQSREVMQKIRDHCEVLGLWSEIIGDGYFENTTIRQLEIRLENDIRIIGLPANPLTARGFTGDVLLDEFAMHRDDEAVWSALFPTVLRGAGELDITSTPRGRKNVFYRLASNPQFSHSTLTLAEAIEQGLEADADEMRAGIGDEIAWRQEFCCEFVDEATSFIPLELIHGCEDAALNTNINWEAISRKGADIYIGVDIGRKHDLTVIWVWERIGDAFITRGVRVLDRAPFAEQEKELVTLLHEPTVQRTCVDATGLGLQLAETLVEKFGDHRVEEVVFSADIKNQLAGSLRVAAERQRLRIPIDETITRDWHSITRLVTSGHQVRYEADRTAGGHADRFWAAALGLRAAENHSTDRSFAIGKPLRFSGGGAW